MQQPTHPLPTIRARRHQSHHTIQHDYSATVRSCWYYSYYDYDDYYDYYDEPMVMMVLIVITIILLPYPTLPCPALPDPTVPLY